MNNQARAHLKQLLDGQRVLSLSVIVNERPYVGLMPFAIANDHCSVLVHASRLAKHTAGLLDPGAFAVLIHQSEEPVGDPLQVPRIILEGKAKLLSPGSAEYHAARERFLARFPQAEMTFGLGDFQLFDLQFDGGRFVEGFARAMDVSLDDLRSLDPPE